MDYELCEYCGHITCQCDKPQDGYECPECGYTPTLRELNRGSCPQCRENRLENQDER